MQIRQLPTYNYTTRPIPQTPTPPKEVVQRDSLGLRHDDINDTLMGLGAVALFGGMALRAIDPKIGSMVAASAGLFLGAALLR